MRSDDLTRIVTTIGSVRFAFHSGFCQLCGTVGRRNGLSASGKETVQF